MNRPVRDDEKSPVDHSFKSDRPSHESYLSLLYYDAYLLNI
jgi:hypothetical protein